MFYVAIAAVLLSLLSLFLVRIPPDSGAVDTEVEAPVVIDVPAIVVDDE